MQGMSLYGVGPHDFVRACASEDSLDTFQRVMKRKWWAIAQECHPDKGGDAEVFKVANAIYNDVMALQVVESSAPRRRVKWAVQIRMETADA